MPSANPTPHPLDAAARREHWLQVCAKHGAECFSCGYFSSREEAIEDMLLTKGHPNHGPDCGSAINIVEEP